MSEETVKPDAPTTSRSKDGLERWWYNGDALITVVWSAMWLGMAISSVHERSVMKDEEFGWTPTIGVAAIILPIAICAYRWGASKRSNDQAQRRAPGACAERRGNDE
jgi:hypothetical protein